MFNKYAGEYRGAAHGICNLKKSVRKEIPIVFHNGFNCDYHFIIKVLAEEFTCLGGNIEKCITCSVPIQKEVARIDENGKENTITIFYRLQFMDSTRFMASSLSNPVDNVAEGIHKIKYKYNHVDKKMWNLRN